MYEYIHVRYMRLHNVTYVGCTRINVIKPQVEVPCGKNICTRYVSDIRLVTNLVCPTRYQ